MSNLQDVPLRIDACHVCGNPADVYHVAGDRVLGLYCDEHGTEAKDRFDNGRDPIPRSWPDGFEWSDNPQPAR